MTANSRCGAAFKTSTRSHIGILVTSSSRCLENHRKTIGKPEENGGLMGFNGI